MQSAVDPVKTEEPVQLLTLVLVLQDGQERSAKQVLRNLITYNYNGQLYRSYLLY